MGFPELARGSKTVGVLAAIAGLIGAAALFGFIRTDGGAGSEQVSTTVAQRGGVDGYGAVSVRVVDRDGLEKRHCALLADTAERRATGMMRREDLGGYDSMLFSFDRDETTNFYMANVPVALSIAWFDSAGKVISVADMEPCRVEARQCPQYSAGAPFRGAIEVLKGDLGDLGIGEGSTVVFGGACA